jgi:hypothetical protein
MRFQSQAQWDKFGEMLQQGKITQKVFDEWAHASPPYHTLPRRVGDRATGARPLATLARAKKK